MEIVPVGSRILVEAKLKPKDVGFIRVGQSVEVKLSAYDYTTYGGLKGKVDYISPDALTDEGKVASGDNSYYRALIRTELSTLKQHGEPLPVIPGMSSVPTMASAKPISPAKMPLRAVLASAIHLRDSTNPMAPARYSRPAPRPPRRWRRAGTKSDGMGVDSRGIGAFLEKLIFKCEISIQLKCSFQEYKGSLECGTWAVTGPLSCATAPRHVPVHLF